MNSNIRYTLQLKNGNSSEGTIRAKIGMPIDDFKIAILDKEGIKTYACFYCADSNVEKV